MKIAVCSDLHLEFGDLDIKNDAGADVLILSGDILVDADFDLYDRRQHELGFARERSQRYHDFFSRVSAEFPTVVYVMGNHEHYHGDFKYTATNIKRKLEPYLNVHLLDKEILKIDDVTFIGGTLWTDMNREDALTMYHIKSMMNDFRCVENSNREVYFNVEVLKDKPVGMTDEEWMARPLLERFRQERHTRSARFTPEDAVEDHKLMLGYIKNIVAEKHDEKFVVVGHHTPSFKSSHPRYKDDKLMNGGYHSDLSEFIMDRPQIRLWTHGHTHEAYDYVMGETRVVCNPRGYIGYEECATDFKLKVVEV